MPDRRDKRRMVSHPKDTGDVGVNELTQVLKRHHCPMMDNTDVSELRFGL